MAVRLSPEFLDGNLFLSTLQESDGPPRYAIFTDLDGTFIDFKTYSPKLTAPVARELVAQGHLLIFCSSKTRAEQQAIMDEIELSVPGIVENGSGIFLPKGCEAVLARHGEKISGGGRMISLGTPSSKIRATILEIERALSLNLGAYGSLPVEKITQRTGLTPEAAARAQSRDFSETLTACLKVNDWNRVDEALSTEGLRALFGGRFRTVTATNCDKGRAVQRFMKSLRQSSGEEWNSVALGDSANDLEMLQAVDKPFLVQRPDGSWSDLNAPGLTRVDGVGPQGWVQVVSTFLS